MFDIIREIVYLAGEKLDPPLRVLGEKFITRGAVFIPELVIHALVPTRGRLRMLVISITISNVGICW